MFRRSPFPLTFAVAALATVVACAAVVPAVADAASMRVESLENAQKETVALYDELANAILSVTKTEEMLVRGILTKYWLLAQAHMDDALAAAGKKDDAGAKMHVEAAAQYVASIANEGDKSVQAIRQRLEEGGHHHHHHASSEESDWILIDAKEKQALLGLSRDVAALSKGKLKKDDAAALMQKVGDAVASAVRD